MLQYLTNDVTIFDQDLALVLDSHREAYTQSSELFRKHLVVNIKYNTRERYVPNYSTSF
jgi:hypothetical protein